MYNELRNLAEKLAAVENEMDATPTEDVEKRSALREQYKTITYEAEKLACDYSLQRNAVIMLYLMCESIKCHNDLISIDNIKNQFGYYGSVGEGIAEMLSIFKQCGIDRFAYTSNWTDAIRELWKLINDNGCSIEGMTQINAMTGGKIYQIPAFIIKINI